MDTSPAAEKTCQTTDPFNRRPANRAMRGKFPGGPVETAGKRQPRISARSAVHGFALFRADVLGRTLFVRRNHHFIFFAPANTHGSRIFVCSNKRPESLHEREDEQIGPITDFAASISSLAEPAAFRPLRPPKTLWPPHAPALPRTSAARKTLKNPALFSSVARSLGGNALQ